MLTLAAADKEVLFIVGGLVAIVAIVISALASVLKVRSREYSRREIAAYIAEGSMTAEQGERLMRAMPEEESD